MEQWKASVFVWSVRVMRTQQVFGVSVMLVLEWGVWSLRTNTEHLNEWFLIPLLLLLLSLFQSQLSDRLMIIFLLCRPALHSQCNHRHKVNGENLSLVVSYERWLLLPFKLKTKWALSVFLSILDSFCVQLGEPGDFPVRKRESFVAFCLVHVGGSDFGGCFYLHQLGQQLLQDIQNLSDYNNYNDESKTTTGAKWAGTPAGPQPPYWWSLIIIAWAWPISFQITLALLSIQYFKMRILRAHSRCFRWLLYLRDVCL